MMQYPWFNVIEKVGKQVLKMNSYLLKIDLNSIPLAFDRLYYMTKVAQVQVLSHQITAKQIKYIKENIVEQSEYAQLRVKVSNMNQKHQKKGSFVVIKM